MKNSVSTSMNLELCEQHLMQIKNKRLRDLTEYPLVAELSEDSANGRHDGLNPNLPTIKRLLHQLTNFRISKLFMLQST